MSIQPKGPAWAGGAEPVRDSLGYPPEAISFVRNFAALHLHARLQEGIAEKMRRRLYNNLTKLTSLLLVASGPYGMGVQFGGPPSPLTDLQFKLVSTYVLTWAYI